MRFFCLFEFHNHFLHTYVHIHTYLHMYNNKKKKRKILKEKHLLQKKTYEFRHVVLGLESGMENGFSDIVWSRLKKMYF